MSVENLNLKKCSKLTYPIVKHDETNIKFDDAPLNISKEWTSVTQEHFTLPKVDNKKKIGIRRELLTKYFSKLAEKDALEEMIGNPTMSEASYLTEYINHFCDKDFTPLLENSKFDIQKLMKDPLYDGNVQTIYKEQFDKMKLRTTAKYRNPKKPFARRSIFTTPPELALEELADGF